MNNKIKNNLYKETNKKFVDRVEHILYSICGCDFVRGHEILLECLKRNKEKLIKKEAHKRV